MINSVLLAYLGLFTLAVNANPITPRSYHVTEIKPGMFYHQGVNEDATEDNEGAIANVGFIIGENCIAVIDSGGSFTEGKLLSEAIKQHSNLPVCYVINTHVHPDHIFGNAAFKSDSVKFVGHEKLPAAIAARRDYFGRVFKDILGKAYKGVEFISPDILVPTDQSLTLDLGNRQLILKAYTTAHTDHDLSVLDIKTRTLWTGDLLFDKRIPVIDGSINGWIDIMNEMKELDIDAVIPGHGEAQTVNWTDSIQRQLDYFVTLRNEIRLIIENLGTIQEATERVGLSECSKWELFENYHRRNITASYVELEWE